MDVLGAHKDTWHGSMPGNHAQVGLIRLLGGRSGAARTTFSLNAGSYVMRFFLVPELAKEGGDVGEGIADFNNHSVPSCNFSEPPSRGLHGLCILSRTVALGKFWARIVALIRKGNDTTTAFLPSCSCSSERLPVTHRCF